MRNKPSIFRQFKTKLVQTIVADITQKALTSTIAPVSTKTNTAEPKQTAIVLVLPSEILPVLPTPAKIAQTISGVLLFHFVNVGQGDSTVIQAPDVQIMLIDGGDPNTGIVEYLQSLGIKCIDLMVATHPHADHIGGLVQILQAFPVSKVIYSGEFYTTKTFEHFIDGIGTAKAEYVEAKRGDVFLFAGISFNVLNPLTPTN